MRIFSSSIIFLFLATPLAAAEINWQVVQPFRFLRFESDHRIHELAHEAARKSGTSFKSRPVSAMEALLNNPTWWEERPEGQAESPRETIEAMRAGEGRSPTRFEPRLGWSSLLRNRADGPVFEGTCWNAYSQSFFGCFSEPGNINGENDYMFPRYHLVRLSVAEDDGSPARQSDCTLSFLDSLAPGSGFLQGGPEDRGSELQSIDFDCGDSVLARIPFDTGLSVGGSADAQPLEAVDVKVTDIVIGSMGDSFASGEGNPDLPAQLDHTSVVRPRYGIDEDGSVDSSVGVPKRQVRPDGRIKGGTAARWIDRRCHRSMYSAHARAAIAVALAGERHHSVTFVSFACSGAEITDGLFWPQDGRECTTGDRAGSRFLEPQISALVGALGQDPRTRRRQQPFANTLDRDDRYFESHLDLVRQGSYAIRDKNDYCRSWPGYNPIRVNPMLRFAALQREIDLLFVGIGGNDMGFAPLVMGMVLTSGFTSLPFNDKMANVYNVLAGGIDVNEANDNLARLPARYAMLESAIRDKLEVEDLGKVLMTTYPNPARGSDGALCNNGRQGRNVSRLLKLSGQGSGHGRLDIGEANQVLIDLNDKVRDNADRGYTIVDGFEQRFATHGICATGAADPFNAETLDLPHKSPSGNEWKIFDPVTAFHPYAKRQRWFRTFNDSFLLMQHFKENAYEEPPEDRANALYLAFRALGGPVHPTAEGHAAVADALYCASVARLFPSDQALQCTD